MFAKLLLLIILIPLVDLLVLLGITRLSHWTLTVSVVVISGFLGAWLARLQWNSIGFKIRDQLVRDNVSASLLTDGAMIFFAAGLLVTPGLLTDLFGLSLLVPTCRTAYKRWARRWLMSHFEVKISEMHRSSFESRIVDGEVVSRDSRSESVFEKHKASA